MKISVFLVLFLCSGVAFLAGVAKGVINPLNPSQLQPHETSETRVCQSPLDCAPEECCVLGMDRYAIPQCKAKGRRGDWCRVNAVPEDRMLYYLDGTVKQVTGVYTLFSTCADDLECIRSKCENINLIASQIFQIP